MKQGNAIRLSIIIVGVILIVASVSVAVAYMLRRSPEITNTFVPAQINCKVIESETKTTVGDRDAVIKTSVTAQNTGNYSAYIRVRVVTYWKDSKGNPVARTSPTNEFDGAWAYNKTDWIYDDTNQTFYHKAPVEVNGITKELLKLGDGFNGITLVSYVNIQDGIEFTYYPTVEFIVEGIQGAPDSAVISSWGVTLDGNGNIMDIAKTN
jgi:hypothetical protein